MAEATIATTTPTPGDLPLQGRVVVITGASSGLGVQMATAAAGEVDHGRHAGRIEAR